MTQEAILKTAIEYFRGKAKVERDQVEDASVWMAHIHATEADIWEAAAKYLEELA